MGIKGGDDGLVVDKLTRVRRIGQLVDASFSDFTLGGSYDFLYVKPFHGMGSSDIRVPKSISSKFQMGKIKSLKLLCILRIVKNSHLLKRSHLSVGGWNGFWSMVWKLILFNELDTPHLFDIFSSNFYKEDNFKTHYFNKRNYKSSFIAKNSSRELFLSKNLIVMNSNYKHRIETLFKNPNNLIDHLSNKSKYYNNLIILDISSLNNTIDRDFLIKLTNLEKIVSFNGNNLTKIDDSILQSWIINLKLQKWKNLKILYLKNTSISIQSLIEIMSISNNNNLFYIETSINLPHEMIPKNWKKIITNSKLLKYQDGLKFFLINRDLRPDFIQDNNDQITTILLDYKIINSNSEIENNSNHNYEHLNYLLNKAWSLRSKNTTDFPNSNKTYYYLLYKKNIKRKPEITPISVSTSSNIKKKPKLNIKTNNKTVNSFFQL